MDRSARNNRLSPIKMTESGIKGAFTRSDTRVSGIREFPKAEQEGKKGRVCNCVDDLTRTTEHLVRCRRDK